MDCIQGIGVDVVIQSVAIRVLVLGMGTLLPLLEVCPGIGIIMAGRVAEGGVSEIQNFPGIGQAVSISVGR